MMGRLPIAIFAATAVLATASMAQVPQRVSNLAPASAQSHIDAARVAAGSLWADKLDNLCRLGNRPAMRDPSDPSSGVKLPVTLPEVPDWPEPPAKIFDNLYFVGSKGVSSFAIDTSAGIIITDAMWAYDVERSVAGGLRAMGLDPHRIKYVIIPHGHPDHYGGANYLRKTFGAKIVAPKGDLETIKTYEMRDTTPVPEAYDLLVRDGSRLTLGDTTIKFYVMPGHTPGGIVMTFPVKSGREKHRMLIWSAGGGTPRDLAQQQAQAVALDALINVVAREKVDALAENHGSHISVHRMRDGDQGVNPFLVGISGVRDFLVMRRECDLALSSR